MAEIPTVDRLVAGYAQVGTYGQDVDTIHADTVTEVLDARLANVPAAETDDTEE